MSKNETDISVVEFTPREAFLRKSTPDRDRILKLVAAKYISWTLLEDLLEEDDRDGTSAAAPLSVARSER
jgi:hypothetical protein